MNAESHSSSILLTELLFGPLKRGNVLGRRDLKFGDYVVSLTAPGRPRMPNGVQCSLTAPPGARVAIGRGRIVVGDVEVGPGPEWNPVPAFGHIESLPPGPEPLASSLAAWVTAPTPAGDELLAGYVAGLVLLHGQRRRAERIAQRAAERADPLSATLLRHAGRGEVPEPVHELLASADPGPLLALAPSGMLWMRGLVSAGFPFESATAPLVSAVRTPASQPR